MTNSSLDTLIDSAFEKDKALLPLQPNEPDAALLAKLGSSAPLPAPSGTGGATSVSQLGASKFLFGIAALMAIGTLSYVLTRSPIHASGSTNPMIFIMQDSSKPNKPSDSVHQREMQSIARPLDKNPILLNQSDSLLMPQTPPKKYQYDSLSVPIRKGHQ